MATNTYTLSEESKALIRVFGTMPPKYMPLVIWSEPIRRVA